MKFTLAKTEVQALLAKAMGIPADSVTITAKELVVDVTQGIETLSFAAPVEQVVVVQELPEETAEEATEEEAPVKAKAKSRAKAKAKPEVVEEEEIEAEDIADDDDDIDFL